MSNKKLDGVFWLTNGDSFANGLLFSLNVITELTKDFPEVLEYKKFWKEDIYKDFRQDVYGFVNREFIDSEIKQFYQNIEKYCSEEEILEYINTNTWISIGDEEDDNFATVGEFFKEIKKKNSEYFSLFIQSILFLAVYTEDNITKVKLYPYPDDDDDDDDDDDE